MSRSLVHSPEATSSLKTAGPNPCATKREAPSEETAEQVKYHFLSSAGRSGPAI